MYHAFWYRGVVGVSYRPEQAIRWFQDNFGVERDSIMTRWGDFPTKNAHTGPNLALYRHAPVACMGRTWANPAAGWRMKHRAK